MPEICVLPQEVVNQIAAGEVVVRPAHLLKELIENALDAGAKHITVEFDHGGRFSQVKDDGCGIKPKEIKKALLPHSTSKINSFEDLSRIKSYGFRGEALASIAEVSDFTLISKTHQSGEEAKKLNSSFGCFKSVENTNSPEGTTVIVKELFKNLPARLKFLKSEAAETTAIRNVLKAKALIHPEVEFRVLHKGKLLFFWPQVENMEKRFKEVLSVSQAFSIKTRYRDVEVEAVMCAPNEVVKTRKGLWFFVEKRWVEDATLYSAVMSAYSGLLMHGEYPLVAVNVSLPEGELDVNIHPSKSQVRFKKPSFVFSAVRHSLRTVLEKSPWIPIKTSTLQERVKEESHFSFPSWDRTQVQKKHFPSLKGESGIPSLEDLKNLSGGEGTSLKPANPFIGESQNLNPVSTQKPLPVEKKWQSLDVLCQAGLTYIVTQSPEALVFIDQHAAHERIIFEQLMGFLNQGKAEVQKRLIPLALDLNESLVEALWSVKSSLLKLGIQLERAGKESVLVCAAPGMLKDTALHKGLVGWAEDISGEGGGASLEKSLSSVCATMACHSAIRAGQSLSLKEMHSLLQQMDEYPLSSFCPHGRPVFVQYSFARLEKDFGRRV